MINIANQNNSIAVTQQLLQSLSVNFTKHKVEQSLLQNPDYPSIAAVHDVLLEYKVNNMVLQVDKQKLPGIPVPFIAHLRGKTNGFLTVTKVSDNSIYYLLLFLNFKQMKYFQSLGKILTKQEQRKIVGGNEQVDPPGGGIGSCESTCQTNRDCPEDRKCASGTCDKKTVYTCHRY